MTSSLDMQKSLKAALDQSYDERAMNMMEAFLDAQIAALEEQRDYLVAQRNTYRARAIELAQGY